MEYSSTTALIVVDVQNDFTDPEGSLYVTGGEDTLPFINAQIAAAHNAGATVVRTQDWHPEHTPHFAEDGGIWPRHCTAGTWGAEFHPDLVADGPVVQKGTGGEDGYSGFTIRNVESGEESSTGLEQLLRGQGVSRVAVVGIATDYCVLDTAVDAVRLGFETTLLADGTRAVNIEPGDAARAIAEMVACGVGIE
ncbi:MAG: bifunctional nicotinamidase/pyrazinamidase [Acidimicrobiia bacterium]|nr:MAG: bifunctional nicotinamidase/pyrazinamidase [Acidimicrobiia bacterium]